MTGLLIGNLGARKISPKAGMTVLYTETPSSTPESTWVPEH